MWRLDREPSGSPARARHRQREPRGGCDVADLSHEAGAILSLDFRGERFLGPRALLEDAATLAAARHRHDARRASAPSRGRISRFCPRGASRAGRGRTSMRPAACAMRAISRPWRASASPARSSPRRCMTDGCRPRIFAIAASLTKKRSRGRRLLFDRRQCRCASLGGGEGVLGGHALGEHARRRSDRPSSRGRWLPSWRDS